MVQTFHSSLDCIQKSLFRISQIFLFTKFFQLYYCVAGVRRNICEILNKLLEEMFVIFVSSKVFEIAKFAKLKFLTK